MATAFHPNLTSLEEEKVALFIAILAKRGTCLTEGESDAKLREWFEIGCVES